MTPSSYSPKAPDPQRFWSRNAKGEVVTDCEGYPYPRPEHGGSPRCVTSGTCRFPDRHLPARELFYPGDAK